MRKVVLIAAAALAAMAIAGVQAQSPTWPTKAVKIIAPFPPGGTADTLGRIAADQLTIALGQPFVVENRAGAGGLIGAQMVAQAEPDGYTLGVSSIASHVIAPAMSAAPPFDTMKDGSHIAYLGGPPVVLVVHPSLGTNTFKEFIALTKNTETGYVTAGTGTHGHLFAEYFAQLEKLKLNHIPYRGANPAMTDLIAGHVKVGTMSWSSAIEQMRAGRVRALAVSSEKRMPEYPDVPTFKELGYDLVAATWFSLSGPANVPKPIVERLNKQVNTILQMPDVQKRLVQDGVEVRLLSPEDFTKFMASEIQRWQPLAKQLAEKK